MTTNDTEPGSKAGNIINLHWTALQSIDQVKCTLRNLAMSFYYTGNTHMHSHLNALADQLEQAQTDAKSSFDAEITERFQESDEHSTLVLKSILASQTSRPEQGTGTTP